MFKAAFYETEITPPLGGVIPGHFSNCRSTDIQDKLFVKAAVIDNGKETVAIAVIDCCLIPEKCHDIVTKRVEEYTGIKAENITVAVNHTHSGAPLTSHHEVGADADEGYVRNTLLLVADCITLAYRRMEPVEISYGTSEVYGFSFNRNFVKRHGEIDTNTGWGNDEVQPLNIPDDVPVIRFEDAQKRPGAEIYNKNCAGNLAGIDPQFTVLAFKREDGSVMGTITNFPLHQAVVVDYNRLSGDYSSILSKELKKEYGDDFVSLFVLGTCGDINDVDFSTPGVDKDLYKKIGKRLALETKSIIADAEPILGDVLIARKEKLILESRQVTEEIKCKAAELYMRDKNCAREMILRNLLVYAAKGGSETIEAFVQCIRIGDVYFYALPGEVYVDFGLYIKKNSPGSKNIVSELANGSYTGYIPIRAAFHPISTLYEIFPNEGSNMEVEGGYKITEKALELANEISKG